MSQSKAFFSLLFSIISGLSYGQLVTTASELSSAISSATSGAVIVLAEGTWHNVFIDVDKNGTASDPIVITAQNPGAVFLTGNSRVYLEGEYLTVSGLVFKDPANLVTSGSTIEPIIELKRCDHCKVLNNEILAYNGTESQKTMTFKWILTDGQYNEIAYNSFVGKYGVGSIINDNRNSTEPDYLEIHHNYFADRTPINGVNDDNDQDAIRIGNSCTSLDDSFTEVYDNYFFNFFGEIEIISNKSGQNKYYNNTFRDYSGTLALRHGNGCEVYGNYFFAEGNPLSGGVRVIGEDHRVYNNYIQGVNSRKEGGSLSNGTGGVNVTNGRPDTEVNGYAQVKNTEVVHNTFVNCDYAIRVGTNIAGDLTLAPDDLTVANNIMYNTSANPYQLLAIPTGDSPSEGNIRNLELTDMTDDGNIYRLIAESAAVDASVGAYSYVSEDVLGGMRQGTADAGAEEFGAGGQRLPYTVEDVGVRVGFGALSNPSLTVDPGTIELGLYGGERIFEINANVDWEIDANASWLEFEPSSGSGRMMVTAKVVANDSGAPRSTIATIREETGGSGLSTELSVLQSDQFVPEELPIIATTSLGMQIKEGISEENAYDDDFTTYWTGDPDTEDEVSITFELDCIHELTDIGIHFWKADERTTTFSLSVAEAFTGPYTTILDNETSAESGATVATEQLFSLGSAEARYIRFVGIGNSSASNWTSIANVNIYGDPNCVGVGVSVLDPNEVDQSFAIYPIPLREGVLTVSSDQGALGVIEIYDVSGQRLVTADGQGKATLDIDVSMLTSGSYFVRVSSAAAQTVVQKIVVK